MKKIIGEYGLWNKFPDTIPKEDYESVVFFTKWQENKDCQELKIGYISDDGDAINADGYLIQYVTHWMRLETPNKEL